MVYDNNRSYYMLTSCAQMHVVTDVYKIIKNIEYNTIIGILYVFYFEKKKIEVNCLKKIYK